MSIDPTEIVYERNELLAFLPAISFGYLYIFTTTYNYFLASIFFSIFGAAAAVHRYLRIERKLAGDSLSKVGKLLYLLFGVGLGASTVALGRQFRTVPEVIMVQEVVTLFLFLSNITVFAGFAYLIFGLEFMGYWD